MAVGSDAERQNVRVGDVLLDPGQLSGPIGTSATVRVKGCDGNSRTLKVRPRIRGGRPSIVIALAHN